MMLACISKRTSWLLRAEEMGLKWKQERMWGDPKGSAILKNPCSTAPPHVAAGSTGGRELVSGWALSAACTF